MSIEHVAATLWSAVGEFMQLKAVEYDFLSFPGITLKIGISLLKRTIILIFNLVFNL